MSRYHWWGFIVNEAGEPIENAEITVKLAGTDETANLYYDEYGNANSADTPALSAGPQLTTLSNGYYEFWIGDVTEIRGYSNDQKFKIEWIRLGVAHGEIDYVNIFPLGPQIEALSLTGCTGEGLQSTTLNKMISNYLGCKWDNHVDSTVIDYNGDFRPIHGLDFIAVDDNYVASELDTIKNKIIDNYHAWHWDHHKLSTVQDYHPSAGRPHGMEEVNPQDGTSSLRNKLVSNLDLFNLSGSVSNLKVYVDQQDTLLQNQITNNKADIDTSRAGWWHIYGDMWVHDIYDVWYVDIHHDLNIWYPLVQVYETDGGRMINTTEITFRDHNVIRVSIHNELAPNDPNKDLHVRIANGGVQRYSPPA